MENHTPIFSTAVDMLKQTSPADLLNNSIPTEDLVLRVQITSTTLVAIIEALGARLAHMQSKHELYNTHDQWLNLNTVRKLITHIRVNYGEMWNLRESSFLQIEKVNNGARFSYHPKGLQELILNMQSDLVSDFLYHTPSAEWNYPDTAKVEVLGEDFKILVGIFVPQLRVYEQSGTDDTTVSNARCLLDFMIQMLEQLESFDVQINQDHFSLLVAAQDELDVLEQSFVAS